MAPQNIEVLEYSIDSCVHIESDNGFTVSLVDSGLWRIRSHTQRSDPIHSPRSDNVNIYGLKHKIQGMCNIYPQKVHFCHMLKMNNHSF